MMDSFSRDPMTAGEQGEKTPKTAQEAIRQVVMANRILSNEGILDALGHGCNIVAENLPRLVASAIHLRENATIQWQALLSGKEIKYLLPEEAKAAMEIALFGASPIERMWRYWVPARPTTRHWTAA
jgi:hypothetical protein